MKKFREGTVNIINKPYKIKGSQLPYLNLSLIPYKAPELNLIEYMPLFKDKFKAIIFLSSLLEYNEV